MLAPENSGEIKPGYLARNSRKARKEKWIGARVRGRVYAGIPFEGIVIGIHLDSQLKVRCDDGVIAFPVESECEILLSPSNLEKKCLSTAIYSEESADLLEPPTRSAESEPRESSKLIPTRKRSIEPTSPISRSTTISEPFTPKEENSISSLADSPAREPVTPVEGKDSITRNPPYGEKESEFWSNPDRDSLLLNNLRELSNADLERFLDACEWSDILSRLKSSRRRIAARDTDESEFLLFPTLTANRGDTNRPAGANRCDRYWRSLNLITNGSQLSAAAMAGIMGFPLTWFEAIAPSAGNSNPKNISAPPTRPAESGPDTSPEVPSHRHKPRSPSGESSTSPASDSLLGDNESNSIAPASESLLGDTIAIQSASSSESDSWNPANFEPIAFKVEGDGQLTIFPTSEEPPDPDDYSSREEYERAWRDWESNPSPPPRANLLEDTYEVGDRVRLIHPTIKAEGVISGITKNHIVVTWDKSPTSDRRGWFSKIPDGNTGAIDSLAKIPATTDDDKGEITPSKCFSCSFSRPIGQTPLYSCLATGNYFTAPTARECERFTPAGKLEAVNANATEKRPRRRKGQGSGSFVTTYANQGKYGKKYPQVSYQVQFGKTKRSIYIIPEKLESVRALDRAGQPIKKILEAIDSPKARAVMEEYKRFLQEKLGVKANDT